MHYSHMAKKAAKRAKTSHSTRSPRSRAVEQIQIILELSKSGIVSLVLISVLGGFFAGHPLNDPIHTADLFLTLFGIFGLAAGSSAINQIQEKHIDQKMKRTSLRPIPQNRLSVFWASLYAGAMLVMGGSFLYCVRPALLLIGFAAALLYNGFYTLWWKRHWAFAAIPGAIPGALPIYMGYVASSGELLSVPGAYLFAILFFWQMPHFWALALRYEEDYRQGGIPTLPVSLGAERTRLEISTWTLAYVGLAFLAPFFSDANLIYLAVSFPMSLAILWELYLFVYRGKTWLKFFLWINFSLIVYIAAGVADHWI